MFEYMIPRFNFSLSFVFYKSNKIESFSAQPPNIGMT